MNKMVQIFGGFEEIGEEDQNVDEDLVSWTLDFIVLVEDVDPEEFEGLVDDVLVETGLHS